MPDRPDLSTIRTSYQATEDRMIDYHPRLNGAVDIPFTGAKRVTATEGVLLDNVVAQRGLLGGKQFVDTANFAVSEAARRFPNAPVPDAVPPERALEWHGNDGHRDAFRHAYWNALMTQTYGEAWTKSFATAHEGLPANPATREAMDLYNNEVGRSIGSNHPHASREQLAGLIEKELSEGRLLVVDRRSNLEWSDRVGRGQHGLTIDETLEPHIGTPGVVQPRSLSAAPGESSSAAIESSQRLGSGDARASGDTVGLSDVNAVEQHPLYASIHGQLPASVSDDKAAELTLGALQNGIESPAQLKAVLAQNDRIFVSGTTPGHRAAVDLDHPAPTVQQMSSQLDALVLANSQHVDAPTRSNAGPSLA